MSPLKLSLINTDNDDPDETIELDDALAGKLKKMVDETPELTMAEAVRQGIAHVAENGPTTGGSTSS
jgi:hypothetical protein